MLSRLSDLCKAKMNHHSPGIWPIPVMQLWSLDSYISIFILSKSKIGNLQSARQQSHLYSFIPLPRLCAAAKWPFFRIIIVGLVTLVTWINWLQFFKLLVGPGLIRFTNNFDRIGNNINSNIQSLIFVKIIR